MLSIPVIAIFYLSVYRKFLVPQQIIKKGVYNDAIYMIKTNPAINNKLGKDLVMMNCTGVIYPLASNCHFELTMFGSQGKGRVHVQASKQDSKETDETDWVINAMELQTKDQKNLQKVY